MFKIAIITAEQANQLKSQECFDYCLFNPIHDANNNWVISEQEINQSKLDWLKELQLITYQPKQSLIILGQP